MSVYIPQLSGHLLLNNTDKESMAASINAN